MYTHVMVTAVLGLPHFAVIWCELLHDAGSKRSMQETTSSQPWPLASCGLAAFGP